MHDQNYTSGLEPMDASNICSPGTLAWSNEASSDQHHGNADAQVKILTRALSNRHVVVWNHDASVLVLRAADADVLGGRGKHLDQHPGNIRLTEVVELFKAEHHHGTSIEKREVIDKILKVMLREGRRFLKLVPYQHDANIWHWVQETMHRAKISQKLRDAYRVWTRKCFDIADAFQPKLAVRPRIPSSRTSSSSSATSVHEDGANPVVRIDSTSSSQLGKEGTAPAHLVTPWGDAIIMCNPHHQTDPGDGALTLHTAPIDVMTHADPSSQNDKGQVQSEIRNSVPSVPQHPRRGSSAGRVPSFHEDEPAAHDADFSSTGADSYTVFPVLRAPRKDDSSHYAGAQTKEACPRARQSQEASDSSFPIGKTPRFDDEENILQIEPIDVFAAVNEICSTVNEANSCLGMFLLHNEHNNGDDAPLEQAPISIPQAPQQQYGGDEDGILQVEPINIFETANEADCQDLLVFIPYEHTHDDEGPQTAV